MTIKDIYLGDDVEIIEKQKKKKDKRETSSQDGGIGRHTVPPRTTKSTTTI